MEERRYLLSVVIPTRNRGMYAVSVVRQILGLGRKEIQIIIQDNSDNDEIGTVISQLGGNVKYHYSSGIISFVDNFNLAVQCADGEYICIIGDDDGILPYIVDIVSWAKENDIEAIKPGLMATYLWPESQCVDPRRRLDNGILVVKKKRLKSKIANPVDNVKRLLRNGCQNYLSYDLAKLYHGIIRRDSLEKIFSLTGSYFGGLSPDIYIAVALSLVVKQIVCIDFPLTISGICNSSGSADSVTGRHTGELKDAPHFRGHLDYKWSSEVPRFYSVETIWADSAIAALRSMGREDLLKYYDPEALVSICMVKYPEYRDIIIKHYKSFPLSWHLSKRQLKAKYGIKSILSFFPRFLSRILNKLFFDSRFFGIANIGEANEKIITHYSSIKEYNTINIIDNLNSLFGER